MQVPPAMATPSPARTEFRPKRVDGDILATLTASALGGEHIEALRLRLATDEELTALGRKPVKTMAMPYFDIDGNVIEFTRYRYLDDPRSLWERTVTQIKPLRYFQPAGTGLHAYFPPIVNWRELAGDPTKPLLITEGEKKSASATQHGFPCIGLGGVDCFSSKKDDSLLLPELMEFRWEGRDVVIIYDSDASTNRNVLMASVKLGRRLMALGATVRIASLKPTKDGAKQGVDDFIANTRKENLPIREAMRQVIGAASADLFERETALYDMNRQFVYIRDMDRVLCREDCALLQPDAFMRRAYASLKHREFKIKTDKNGAVTRTAEEVSSAAAWMEWEGRLTSKFLDFTPGAGEFTPHGYNLWRGWPVEPREGSVKLWSDLLDVLFDGAPQAERDWFERWCAFPLQNPGAKLKTACLLWSKLEGTGKSTVLECLRAVYGNLYVPMNDSAVDLQYTDWLVNKLMVGVDDIAAKNRDDHAAKWKNLITAPRLTIQKKYTPTFEVASHVNFIMTSNDANALRIGPTDRRYFIHRVGEWGTVDTRTKFFNRVYDWLEKDGPSALLAHFLALPMGDFEPDAPAPLTRAKREMADLSQGPLEKWIEDVLDAPEAVLRVGNSPLEGDLWTADDLAALYNARPATKTTVSRITMGMALGNANVPQAQGGAQIRMANHVRARLFIIRNAKLWESATNEALRDHYASTRGRL